MHLESHIAGFVALILAIVIVALGSWAVSHAIADLIKDETGKAFLHQNP